MSFLCNCMRAMPPRKPPKWDCHAVSVLMKPAAMMTVHQSRIKGSGLRRSISGPRRPRSIIVRKATAKRPLIAPDAPMTGADDVGVRMANPRFPAKPQSKKVIAVAFAP